MAKLWRHWYGKLLIVGPIVLIVFAAASLVAASYTERSSFCVGACHEMAPYGATWKTSVHRAVPCVKCHIRPGTVELVKAKAAALREVYVHLAGEVKAPISVTRHVPDSACSQGGCHARRATYDRVVLRDVGPPADAVGMSSTTYGGGAAARGYGGGTSLVAETVVPSGTAPAASASAETAAGRPTSPAPPVVFSHRQHTTVPLCIECHDRVVHRVVPGKTFIDPRSMAFCMRCHNGERAANTCEACHTPPHDPRGVCTDCHDPGTWATTFKHPIAVGVQHQKLVCERCHSRSTPGAMGFAGECVSCHAKRHRTVSAVLCADCHVPTHFRPSTFQHPTSGCETCHTPPHASRGPCLLCHTQKSWANRRPHPFPLAGSHTSFACEKCHTNGFSAPGLSCDNCHHRPHTDYGWCLDCHTMTSFAAHVAHPFVLAGRHTSFACERCHTNGINAPGVDCDSCHHRPHPYYGPCLKCHTMTSFASRFSHPFQLAGQHRTFACTRCHVNGIGSPGVACTRCHGSNHGGLTDCARCHTQAGWLPTTFRHGNARMEGWQRMACSSCHPNKQFAKLYCSCHGANVPSGD